MSLLTPLVAFHLREVVPAAGPDVADFVAERLAQPAGPLVAALDHAAGRTWRALAAALLPGRALEMIRATGAGDALWIEDQLRRFAEQTSGRFGNLADKDRAACLAEWLRAQQQGRISRDDAAMADLPARTAAQVREDAPAGLTAAAGRAERLVADSLAAEFPRLAALLRRQTAAPPLLVAAFAYFFRREVESNDDLSGELLCDGLRRLSAPLAAALGGLGQALARLGSRFDALAAPPEDRRAEAKAVPAHRADRPSPFVAVRRGRASPTTARPSAYLVSPSDASSSLAPGAPSKSRPGPGFVNALGMPFVWAPPGEFLMGSAPNEVRRDADEKARQVRISRGYFFGAHPVTRGQFAAFVRETHYVTEAERKDGVHRGPSGEWRLDPWCNWKRPDFPQDDDHPVVCVSWNDARAFCDWLAGRERQKEGAYRLPKEAEWEYACRAGTTTPYWHGDALNTDQANYNGQADGGGLFREGTTPVWIFPPNAWGIYDVHGNVWEWCADWYGPYPDGAAADPRGPASGRQRVLRGGSWRNAARFLRSAARNQISPSGRDRDVGFRICLVV